MAFLDSGDDDAGQGGPPSPPPDAGGGGPPPGGGGPPQGGGPIIAALARRQGAPQVSAPGPGNQATSMTMIQQAIAMIQQALPGLGQGTPIHKDALRAVQALSRHVAQGQPTAGVQQTQLMDMLRSLGRNAILQRILQSAGGQQGGNPNQPAGPSPIRGAASPAPMPSTPMPGA